MLQKKRDPVVLDDAVNAAAGISDNHPVAILDRL